MSNTTIELLTAWKDSLICTFESIRQIVFTRSSHGNKGTVVSRVNYISTIYKRQLRI